jgi:hypothetical protein
MASRRIKTPYVSPQKMAHARETLALAVANQQAGIAGENEDEDIPEETESDSEFTEHNERILQERQEKAEAREAEKQIQADTIAAQTKISVGEMPVFDRGSVEQPKPTKPPAIKGIKGNIVAERTQQWTTFLTEDFNPLLVKFTGQWVGIPNDAWLDTVVMQAIDPATNKVMTFWEPSLRTRLELSEKKAKKLAAAAAEFSVSPMGVAVVTWVEMHQFMIAVGGALIVAAQYGWSLMQTKAEVAQLKKVWEEQQRAQIANMQQGKMPGFQEQVVDRPETNLAPPGFNQSVSEYENGMN